MAHNLVDLLLNGMDRDNFLKYYGFLTGGKSISIRTTRYLFIWESARIKSFL